MALSLISARCLSRLSHSAAPRACCSVLPHARALFVNASQAPTARRPRRRDSARQSTLPAQVPSQVLYQAAQLTTRAAAQPNSRQALSSIYGASPSDLLMHPLLCLKQLLGRSRRNPRANGRMQLRDGVNHLVGRLQEAVQQCSEELSLANHNSRLYLGIYPPLKERADQQESGTFKTGDAWTWLFEAPQAQILADIKRELKVDPDITREELCKRFHIDHVLPNSKGGLNHPCNYYIMDSSTNESFGGRQSLPKCQHVGIGVTCAVLWFHAKKLLSESQLELMESLWDWQALSQAGLMPSLAYAYA